MQGSEDHEVVALAVLSVEFATERLVAEALDPSQHEQLLAALHADPRVMASMGGTRNDEQNHAWIEENIRHADEEGFGVFVFRDRRTKQFVGRGAIRRVEIGGAAEVEIGYVVTAGRWGRGLATELGAWLVGYAERRGLHGLVAFTLPDNAASRRVMEKLGFMYEREVVWHTKAHVLYRRPSGLTPAEASGTTRALPG